jgi:hypothetical protein
MEVMILCVRHLPELMISHLVNRTVPLGQETGMKLKVRGCWCLVFEKCRNENESPGRRTLDPKASLPRSEYG